MGAGIAGAPVIDLLTIQRDAREGQGLIGALAGWAARVCKKALKGVQDFAYMRIAMADPRPDFLVGAGFAPARATREPQAVAPSFT